MNDATQAEITKWATGLRETAEKAGGFVLEQAPEVAKEIILLGRAWHTAAFVMSLTAVSTLAILAWRYRKELASSWDDAEAPGVVACIAGPIAGLVLAVLSLIEFSHMLTAWFAPRLYLIGELASLAGRAAGGPK